MHKAIGLAVMSLVPTGIILALFIGPWQWIILSLLGALFFLI